jgi:DNA mismatch repair protein MSH5
MGEESGRLHVVTGPNSSGKSVYMKQAGLIVYLAHVGCWVPAAGARIPLTDKLFTRIQTVESVSLGLSAFLCDVNQVGSGNKNWHWKSLLPMGNCISQCHLKGRNVKRAEKVWGKEGENHSCGPIPF